MARKPKRVGAAGMDDYGRLWDLLPEAMRGRVMDALSPTPSPVVPQAPGMVGPPMAAEEGLLARAGRGAGNLAKGAFRKAPVGTTMGLVQLATMFREPIGEATDSVGLNPWRQADRTTRMNAALQGDRLQAESDRKRQELEELTQENMGRIMQLQPELGQSILAGRRIPRGARVIGGQPRVDLLQQVAMHMAQGGFGPPPGMEMGPQQQTGMGARVAGIADDFIPAMMNVGRAV